jgi:leucine dehydrogenase
VAISESPASTPTDLFSRIQSLGFEQVQFCHDRTTGLRAIIAIHDTTLGPALGGIRMRPYANEEEALTDVLRLARAMTYKSAVAGLDLGGGKSVIIGDPREKNEALMRAMGRFIHALSGRYIAATDVGTTSDDITYVRAETPFVTGVPEAWGGHGDTSILTSLTVYLGMKAGAEAAWGSDSLRGRRAMIQGSGKVGQHLMEHLEKEGAELLISDVVPESVQRAAERFRAQVVPVDAVYDVECDIFSPNALGAVLNDLTIPRLRCKLVCGGANNQLAEERHAEELERRGILYAPDFVVNSGGVISAEGEVLHAPRERAASIAQRVGDTTRRIFRVAQERGVTTARAAELVGDERLERMAGVRRSFVPGDLHHSRPRLD